MEIAPTDRMSVGIIVEHRTSDHPWGGEIWRPVAALPGLFERQAWSELSRAEGAVQYFAGSADLDVFRGETETYKYNLESAQPAIYVVLRQRAEAPGVFLLKATVCPGEAHAHADTGEDIVEPVPMPPLVRDWLEEFVRLHHVERPHYKRERDRADPESLAVRPAGIRKSEAPR